VQGRTMQISPVNNNGNKISTNAEKRYAEEAAMALASMGNLFSDVLNNIQADKSENQNKSDANYSQNVKEDHSSQRKANNGEVDNNIKSADNSPKKSETTDNKSEESKNSTSTEKKSEDTKMSKSDSISSVKADSNQSKQTTSVSVKSDLTQTDTQTGEQTSLQEQMDFVKKFENANIKVSVKSESVAVEPSIKDIQNMFMANSSAANIENMSDNLLKNAGIKELFDGKSFEQIKEILNNSGSGFSDMSGFNFEFNGQKILDRANNLKFEKVIRTQIKDFAAKLTSVVKNVPNSTNATAKMVLRPESLGTVFVDINSTEGVVKLKIKAQSQEVIDKLEAQIAELRQKLEKSGLVAEHIEFALYEEGENAFNSFAFSKEKQDEMEARKDFVRSFTGLASDSTQDEPTISSKNGIEQYI
jgi:flagellar hook-length control protein FliK